MARIKKDTNNVGYFGIGVMNNDDAINIGTLWRSAYIMGASFVFTLAKKYKIQGSDVTKAWTKIPLYHYKSIEELRNNWPYACPLVAVELTQNAIELSNYNHPPRAVYLLGNEQIGLSENILSFCHETVKLPGNFSMNVAVAGSILLYDRVSKCPTNFPSRSN